MRKKKTNHLVRAMSFAGLLMLASPVVVGAQEQPADGGEAEDPAESRSTAFVAMEGPDAERVPGGMLLIASYAFIWLAMMGYMYRMSRMSAATARDVERLEKSLDSAVKGEKSGD